MAALVLYASYRLKITNNPLALEVIGQGDHVNVEDMVKYSGRSGLPWADNSDKSDISASRAACRPFGCPKLVAHI